MLIYMYRKIGNMQSEDRERAVFNLTSIAYDCFIHVLVSHTFTTIVSTLSFYNFEFFRQDLLSDATLSNAVQGSCSM